MDFLKRHLRMPEKTLGKRILTKTASARSVFYPKYGRFQQFTRPVTETMTDMSDLTVAHFNNQQNYV